MGVNRTVSDENFEAFQDYFAERTVSSDESSDTEKPELPQSQDA